MKHRLSILLLLAALPIAACTAEPEPAAPADSAAATPSTDTAATAAPAPAAAETAAPAAAETAPAEPAPEASAPAEAAAPPAGPTPVEGTDYSRIEPALPYAPQAGKVEVVEVFGYTCPHCASLEPLIDEWRAKQQADVSFQYLPAAFGGFWTPYARAFFTAETMGLVDKTHEAMFKAVHIERTLPPSAEAGPQIAQWYGSQGADADTFASTMDSFAVNAKIKRSQQLLQHWGIDGTPTMVVNGKYRVGATAAGGPNGMLHTVDWLVAQERAAK